MTHEISEQELADDLSDIQRLISELAGEDVHKRFVEVGPRIRIEERIKAVIKKILDLKRKYKDSPVKIRGFSITLGAGVINSSASINFEF